MLFFKRICFISTFVLFIQKVNGTSDWNIDSLAKVLQDSLENSSSPVKLIKACYNTLTRKEFQEVWLPKWSSNGKYIVTTVAVELNQIETVQYVLTLFVKEVEFVAEGRAVFLRKDGKRLLQYIDQECSLQKSLIDNMEQ